MTIEAGRDASIHRVLDTVWRMESPRLVGALTRIVRDVGLAEDLAQDALEAALRQWPDQGIPANPAAWLMATARNHAIDTIRRRATHDRKAAELGRAMEQAERDGPDLAEAVDNATIGDDLLRLVFMCCHPVLSVDARVTLTLRLLGGLSADEIARAFLTTETTVAQRIVRAKRTLREARVEFEVPSGADFDGRLASVLQVIYLVFNEGYSATAGADWVRPALCEDALRLGRVLAGLVPDEAEVYGLLALMEIQASRLRARTAPDGLPIPLLDQNRARWDHLLIRRGLAALERAQSAPGTPGPYTLQAAIAACHARAATPEGTDWEAIVALYDALLAVMPSPVVALNRAVAVGMADGPAAGLAEVDSLAAEPVLTSYHLLPAVRGDLLVKLGRLDEGAAELARAASMTANGPERTFLLERARSADARARRR
jgi:RNA polymerase sigma factor (sigma-70 family)